MARNVLGSLAAWLPVRWRGLSGVLRWRRAVRASNGLDAGAMVTRSTLAWP